MRTLPAEQLNEWISSAEVLEQDARGPKVLRLASGHLLKIFRTRRRHFIARLRPAALRFQLNAVELSARGIIAPKVCDTFWLDRSAAVSGCLYEPVVGQPLDKLLRNQRADFDAGLPALAAFIFRLHQQGIYFRSLHLGNILLTPAYEFALIDFLDIRFKHAPLGNFLVKRNFRHLHNYLIRSGTANFPWTELQANYDACHRQQ